jgi:hypothetical protein
MVILDLLLVVPTSFPRLDTSTFRDAIYCNDRRGVTFPLCDIPCLLFSTGQQDGGGRRSI